LENPDSTYRYRIYYKKGEAIRYIGHLDLHRAWERSLRRAGLPMTFSQGYHPQPRMQQACALPLGFTSLGEVIDVWLVNEYSPAEIQQALNRAVPPGLEITAIEMVDLKSPPLQTRVRSSRYLATLLDPAKGDEVIARVTDLLNSTSLPRERRGKSYDLRPLIEALSADDCVEQPGKVRIHMLLSAREGATGRPEEVLESLGLDPLGAQIQRVELVFADPRG